jgi:hypothetical protein
MPEEQSTTERLYLIAWHGIVHNLHFGGVTGSGEAEILETNHKLHCVTILSVFISE